MTENDDNPPAATDGGFDVLGQHDRLEFRVLTDEQELTDDIVSQLVGELDDWRKDHPGPRDPGRPFPLNRTAQKVGVSPSTLTEVLKGSYRGDRRAVFGKIDQFLADERARAGRLDFRQHAQIHLTRKIFATLNAAVKHNKLAAIIGPSGCGKTAHALAYQRDRSGALYLLIRSRKEGFTDRDASALLCHTIQELRPMKLRPHRRRCEAIESWLLKRRNTVLLLDEAQFLDRSGYEFFRLLHDITDPGGHHGMPIAFFGDEKFHKLLVQTKQGEPTIMAPQLARRIMFIFDIRSHGRIPGSGNDVFSEECLLKIARADRVKYIRPAAVRWLTCLANTPDSGMLGAALDILKIACDLGERETGAARLLIDVEHLRKAFRMSFGDSLAEIIDQAAGGELLRKVGG